MTEVETDEDKGHCQDVIGRDLDTRKVDLKSIASSLDLEQKKFSTWINQHMIRIVYGGNIVDGIAGGGPDAWLASTPFYRRWYIEKALKDKP